MSRKTSRRLHAALDALYARLPHIACRGLCGIACGPIAMTTLEAERMRRADPGRRLPMIHPTPVSDVTCVYLTAGARCSVYAVRPLICRMWGLTKRMSCIHGCVPERWVTDHEYVRFAQAVERLGGPNVASTPEGPIPITDSFLALNFAGTSAEAADETATKTRDLRALLGGYVMDVHPSEPGEPAWVDLDADKRQK